MRHLVTAILPPRGSLTIKISPPIALDERAMIFTVSGPNTVTVAEETPERVTVVNSTDKITPALFVIASKAKDPIPQWARTVYQFFKG